MLVVLVVIWFLAQMYNDMYRNKEKKKENMEWLEIYPKVYNNNKYNYYYNNVL